jgi:ubiquinone/menaquinone biosynthesis C-methylase UbiE
MAKDSVFSRSSLNGVRNYYDRIAGKYDLDYEEANWRLYDALTWAYIEPFLPEDKNLPIVDAGGGTAKWAIKIAKLGYHVICGDISTGMLDVAKQKIASEGLQDAIKLRILDIRAMDSVPDESTDLVLAVGDVISYAMDDDLAVGECFRVLRPGGRCIASVDNKFTYILNQIHWNQFDRIQSLLDTGISDFFRHHPVKTYFTSELHDLFTRHGFEVERLVGKPVLVQNASKKERRHKLEPNYELILKLELLLSSDPSLAGNGGHLQVIARKPVHRVQSMSDALLKLTLT